MVLFHASDRGRDRETVDCSRQKMGTAMAEDLMRYDLLAQEALRGVVRSALQRVARTGLPGEHHFYIAFKTRAPGVGISDRLLEKYPNEMTIVLQHQFWGLDVGEDRFIVELSFDNVPEKLFVPFTAVSGFFDPSVQFGLQFETAEANENADQSETTDSAESAEMIADNEDAAPKSDADSDDDGKADVVSLDAFRKK